MPSRKCPASVFRAVRVWLLAVGCLVVACTCDKNGNPFSAYTPPVVFSAYVNQTWEQLDGNKDYPNTAKMAGDTLRMYFYSDTFHVSGNIWSGDLLRIDIYPHDSLQLISERNGLVRFVRYYDAGINMTYEITPQDTLNDDDNMQMTLTHCGTASGDSILIQNISMSGKGLQTDAVALTVTKGIISGRVQ